MSIEILNNLELVGKNLKKLRLISEKSLNDIAAQASISSSFLSLAENGKRRIKFDKLRAILEVYDYSLIYFISEIIDELKEYHYSPTSIAQRKENRILIDGSLESKYCLELLRPMRYQNDTQVLELYLKAKSETPESYYITGTEIRGYVKEGTLLIQFHDDEERVFENEEFSFVARSPFSFRNYTKSDCKVILMVSAPGI